MTILDLVTDALRELMVLDAEGVADGADSEFVLGRIESIFDRWNLMGINSVFDAFLVFTGSAIAPHSIGPSTAAFTIGVRPEYIYAANLRSSASALATRTPIHIRDEDWWIKNSTPGTYGTITDLYYRPTVPNGELNFWPLPTGTFYVELVVRNAFGIDFPLDTVVQFPPGFKSAVVKTLAIEIAPAFLGPEGKVNPLTLKGANDAVAALLQSRGQTWRVKQDLSLPGSGGVWDFRTSTYR